jgi:ribosomal protein S18 acetylase RimI-like enzyme
MRLVFGGDLPRAPQLDVGVRNPTRGDAEALAVLMLDAWRDSIDFDPTDTLDGARAEIAATFAGDYGEPLPEASFVAFAGHEALSASLVTRYEGAPFVAFTMTRGARKGQGLARALLTRSIRVLADAGETYVDLEVTVGNEPAEHLYRSLGFEVVGGPEG